MTLPVSCFVCLILFSVLKVNLSNLSLYTFIAASPWWLPLVWHIIQSNWQSVLTLQASEDLRIVLFWREIWTLVVTFAVIIGHCLWVELLKSFLHSIIQRKKQIKARSILIPPLQVHVCSTLIVSFFELPPTWWKNCPWYLLLSTCSTLGRDFKEIL